MIVAKELHYITTEKAASMDWYKLTRGFNESAIDAFIEMQNNMTDKLSVCDMIMNALKNGNKKCIFEDEIISKLELIKCMIEQGVYSPYKEIERLMSDNAMKDYQIIKLMEQLEAVKKDGDDQKETELITEIVKQAIRAGVEVARNVELVLGRIYRGTTKFLDLFNLLGDYIADPMSNSLMSKILNELNSKLESVKENTEKPFTLYADISNYKPKIQTQTVTLPQPSSGYQGNNYVSQ